MPESIGTARIDVVVDAEKALAEIKAMERGVTQFSTQAQAEYNKYTASQKKLADSMIRQAAMTGRSRGEQIAYNAQLKIGGALGDEIARKALVAQSAINAQTAAVHGATKAFSGSSKTARELQFAMRGLPAQITDIGVSLASGQRPMMVLLQQGGQLKDMFGGIRPAAAALATALRSIINPATLAAAAIGLLVVAWRKASNEADAFNRAIVMTGNFAGVSTRELEAMADRLAGVTDATTGAAREAVAQVTATGRFTKEQIESVARAALEMKEATGQSVDETIQAFVRLADDPVRAIETLNKTQHLLDPTMVQYVKRLDEQGEHAKAAALAIELVTDATIDRADEVERHLSLWGTLWHDAGEAAKGALDSISRAITDADATAASADNLRQLLIALNPALGAGFGVYLANAKVRTGERGKQENSVSGFTGPQFFTPGLSQPFSVTTPQIPFKDAGRNDFAPAKQADAAKQERGLRGVARAAQEAQRALAALNREEERMTAASLAAEDARTRAMVSWAEIVAQLNGPVAYAEFQHEQRLWDIEAAGKAAGRSAEEIAEAQRMATAEFKASTEVVHEAANTMNLYADQAARNMQDAFADFLFDPFKDGVDGMVESFGKALQRMAAEALSSQIFQSLGLMGGATLGGESAGTLFDLFSGSGFGFAKGGVFNNSPSLSAYSGGVYDHPQLFKFARGAGIFGEAGPEAIMPLQRGSDGKLGVAAHGADSQLRVTVNLTNKGEPMQAKQTGMRQDGNRLIIDMVLDAVAGDMSKPGGKVNSATAQAFGLSRRGIAVA